MRSRGMGFYPVMGLERGSYSICPQMPVDSQELSTGCGQAVDTVDNLRTVCAFKQYGRNNSMSHGEQARDRLRASKEDYLAALEAAGQDVDLNGDDGGRELSEAERLAAAADAPAVRADGQVRGSEIPRQRPLTHSQTEYVRGLIQGKTMRQAYREAYPTAKGDDRTISAAAYRLSRDPRVRKSLQDAWGETVEALAEDVAATKRYVLKELLALSKAGKQEGSRLKALELMGRAAGMFQAQEKEKEQAVSPETLRRELAGHLKLLDNVKPISKAQVREG